jgi:hypothetical protein
MKMSDIKNQDRYIGTDRRTPRVEPGVAKPADAVPREVFKTGGRHAAITTDLYSWHSYKNWADKVKGSWEDKK